MFNLPFFYIAMIAALGMVIIYYLSPGGNPYLREIRSELGQLYREFQQGSFIQPLRYKVTPYFILSALASLGLVIAFIVWG